VITFVIFPFLSVLQAWFILFENFVFKAENPWAGVGIYFLAILLTCLLLLIHRLIMSLSGESTIPSYIYFGIVLTASFGLILAHFVIHPDDLTSMIMIGVHFLVGQAIGCFSAYAIGNK
jgi:hypothetical protein